VKKLAAWSAVAALLAVAMARVAVWLQSAGFSTVMVFPVVIGAVLGGIVSFMASQLGESRRMLVVVGSLMAAAVCASAEHGFFYLDYRSHFAAKLQSDPTMQLAVTMNPERFRPAPFSKFMSAAAAENWPLWIVDAFAMIAAAGATAWLVFPSRKAPARPLTPDS
jgi:hypothetical protein